MAELIYYPKISDWWSATVKVGYTAVYDQGTNQTTVTFGTVSHQYFGRAGYYSKCTTNITVTAEDNATGTGKASLELAKATNGGNSFTVSGVPSPSKVVVQHSDAPGSKSVKITGYTEIFVAPMSTSEAQETAGGSGSVSLKMGEVFGTSEVAVSDSSVKMGSKVTISIDRKSNTYTHTLRYKFGGVSETIATNVAASYIWTVPLSLAAVIPDAVSGVVEITCTTYNGTAEIGADTVSFTAVVPNNNTTCPEFLGPDFVLEPTGGLGGVFSGLFIRGKTGLKAKLSATSAYSTVKSYNVTFNGVSKTGSDVEFPAITISGELNVTGIVTDARGYSTSVTKKITVIPYDSPRVTPYTGENEVIAVRCLADGTPDDAGTSLLLRVGLKYSPIVSGGVQKNFCELKYCYKVSAAESYGDWAVLIARSDTSVTEVSLVVTGLFPSVTTSYKVKIAVLDDLTGYHDMEFIITTDDVTFHLREGGKGAAFGKYSEEDFLLDLHPDWWLGMRGYKTADFVVEQGTSGVWTYRKWYSGLAECWATSASVPNTFPIVFVDTPKRLTASAYGGSGYDIFAVGRWK